MAKQHRHLLTKTQRQFLELLWDRRVELDEREYYVVFWVDGAAGTLAAFTANRHPYTKPHKRDVMYIYPDGSIRYFDERFKPENQAAYRLGLDDFDIFMAEQRRKRGMK